MSSEDLINEKALRLKTYLTLATAEVHGLDTHRAFLAVLMLRDGTTAAEAVRLVVEGDSLQVAVASQEAADLLAHVRADLTRKGRVMGERIGHQEIVLDDEDGEE